MNYYRKPINKAVDDIKLKMQIGTLTVKITENINKIDNLLEVDKDSKKDITDNSNSIKNMKNETDLKLCDKVDQKYINDNYLIKENTYDKKYIDDNFLNKEDIESKDNAILNKINNNFYNRNYINDNYLIKGNIYDKKYIDDIFFTKRVLNNSFSSFYTRIDAKDDEVLKEIENNYYNKNELNDNFNNLYNRTYLDKKFDNIYNKTEVNNIKSTLNSNIVLFNTNLTNFIDKTYKNDKEDIDENIKDNKDTINNFINTFTTFSNNISNINTDQNSRLTNLEDDKITDSQSNKLKLLENIDLEKINPSYNFSVFNKGKLDKMRLIYQNLFLLIFL